MIDIIARYGESVQ